MKRFVRQRATADGPGEMTGTEPDDQTLRSKGPSVRPGHYPSISPEIDGIIPFAKNSMAVISVAARETIGVAMIRHLRGAMERTDAEIGITLALLEGRKAAKATAGSQHETLGFAPVPRLQIVMTRDARTLRDRAAQIPARLDSVQKVAPKQKDTTAQKSLL